MPSPSPLERINNPVEFARQVSLELDLLLDPTDKPTLLATVQLLNQPVWAKRGRGDLPAEVKSAVAYLDLPPPSQDVELFSHRDMENSEIHNSTIHGNFDCFRWVGTSKMGAFGLHLVHVNVLRPEEEGVGEYSRNAFIPVDMVKTYNELFDLSASFEL